jgi:hypothetical protein
MGSMEVLSLKARPSWCHSMLLPLLVACGGENDDAVSYARQVKPLFSSRCVPCHHSTSGLSIVDLEDPFTQDNPPGAVGSENEWHKGHPAQNPFYNIVPFDPAPEVSFLMEKITNTDLTTCDASQGHCRRDDAGSFMPLANGRLPAARIADLRQWISDGAQNDRFYATKIATIFSNPFPGPDDIVTGPCAYCHYPGSPDPPDFTKMFDPVEGLVGKSSTYRNDIKLVDPGNPDGSFLIMKVELEAFSSEFGAPMPRQYEPLSAAQVEIIRQWIAEGARNN